jgi:hypothetical protein
MPTYNATLSGESNTTQLGPGLATMFIFFGTAMMLSIVAKLRKAVADESPAAKRMRKAMNADPTSRAAGYAVNTTAGKSLSYSLMKFDGFMVIALSYIVSSSITDFVRYEISLVADQGQAQVTYILFSFTTFICYTLVTTGIDSAIGYDPDVTKPRGGPGLIIPLAAAEDG